MYSVVRSPASGEPSPDEETEQIQWSIMIQQNLEQLFADDPSAFIVGDLFWYPLKGGTHETRASDIMVVFGRLKGKRGAYKQWSDEDICPQVVFEVLAPSYAPLEMERKLRFYERYGAEEYYMYQPDQNLLRGWQRQQGTLAEISPMADWVSPATGISFDLSGPKLQMRASSGEPFRSYAELGRSQANQTRAQVHCDAVSRLLNMGLSAEQVADALGMPVTVVQDSV